MARLFWSGKNEPVAKILSENTALRNPYTLPAMKVDRRNLCSSDQTQTALPGVDAEKATRGASHISWPNH